MPYNPGIEYRGDKHLFEGITQAGQGLAQGLQNWQNNRNESAFLDQRQATVASLLAPLAKTGQIDPKLIDDLAKFPSLSLSQKRGKLAGLEFLVDQAQKQQAATAENQRHEDSMGLRRAELELRRGELLAGDNRRQQTARAEEVQGRDTLGMLLGLSGQEPLPSPVDPSNAGAYLRQQYPNADASVVRSLLMDQSPMALRRLAVDEGNLGVAEAQARNRAAEAAAGTKERPKVRVTENQYGEKTYSWDMPWEEFQASNNPTQTPPTGPQGKPGSISTQAEYDALPRGATYTGKDGKTYRKP